MSKDDARRMCNEGFEALEAGRLDDARRLLEQARAGSPDDPLVHFRLALLHADKGNPREALDAVDRSLALDPSNARAHNNRGTALEMMGRVGEAEQSYRRAMELDADLAQPILNLGHLLEKRGAQAEAGALYERAIAHGLDVERFNHQLAAIGGRSAKRAPDEWVRATFDNFAPTFDARLDALGYATPRKLGALLAPRLRSPCDMLDLGCGTGQCGAAIASFKGRLVGVDLSSRMLAQARSLGVYDELHAAEVGGWLAAAASGSFDLVLAGDVFVYIGSLADVFAHAARVLRPRGWFAFSIEDSDGDDYVLRLSGRFAQSRAYIARLAARDFAIAAEETGVIRMESGLPVAGRLFLLQKR